VPESVIVLPEPPDSLSQAGVKAWRQDVTIDTYAIGPPDPYPEFLSARVFQGSSGKVFPLPFFERISAEKQPKNWTAIHLMNRYVRLMILPQLGGRIAIGVDLTNGYDFFYRNNVIKPALVGLAGPWLSGGVEFNWPQHHRPATCLPTDWMIEHSPDGSATVWCSDLDPFARMKGMHGVKLAPDSSVIELRVRAYNRTEDVQTFLWWSNVAARVGDDYQSFFPPDVTMVADHAKRACATFPRVSGSYYGVNYPAQVTPDKPDADRLDWYRNIPVPTSYMVVETAGDFFGGYDHGRQAGFVYWADRRVAPGKKQWTWGNAPFGWAWDRHLTDSDGPYVELMAGAYTDNQPDFSYLRPGETKTFSQYWYPISQIGPVQNANLEAALALAVSHRQARIGLAVTRQRPNAIARLSTPNGPLWQRSCDLYPGRPLTAQLPLAEDVLELTLTLEHDGQTIGSYCLKLVEQDQAARPDLPILATPIPPPPDIPTVEELALSARHLEQYRHATRSPEPYLLEALKRDPGHSPALLALAARRYRQGLYQAAASYARQAIERLTSRNPNPFSGEAHWRLGLALRRLGQPIEAADALMKASWDEGWRSASLTQVAQMALSVGDLRAGLAHAKQALVSQADSTRLRNMAAWAELRCGDQAAAASWISGTLALDPLDWWARDLAGQPLEADPQTLLDVASEYAGLGDWAAVARLAGQASAEAEQGDPGMTGARPLADWYEAYAWARLGQTSRAGDILARAAGMDRGTCQLIRLNDYDLANWVAHQAASLTDPNPPGLLGNWCYHNERPGDGIVHWERAVTLNPADAVAWRNLGMAAYNVSHDPAGAQRAYQRALVLRPDDAKLLREYDQLEGRLGRPVSQRLARLRARPDLVAERDDLTVSAAELATLAGQPFDAIRWLTARRFQPWEGGEGMVLAAWEQAHRAAAELEPDRAVDHLRAALAPPDNLGEARHPLANVSDLWLALGDGLAARGDQTGAVHYWTKAADFEGDFQQMSVMRLSDLTYYSILALGRLGRDEEADRQLAALERYIAELDATVPEIDYFATSLPAMLLFNEDLVESQARYLLVLRAQVAALRGQEAEVAKLVAEVLRRDPADPRVTPWAPLRP
jgi:tetratricopeptide (TPR) repeat protein